MSHRPIAAWLVLVIATVAGCAGIEPIEPIRPVDMERPLELLPGEGFALLEIDSNTPVRRLVLGYEGQTRGRFEILDLAPGRQTLLFRIPAGTYRWHRIETPGVMYRGRDHPFWWDLDPEVDHWRFEVEPGKANYPGILVLLRNDRWLTTFTLNRSGELAQRLLRSAEWLLLDQPIVYTGRRRDDFLEHYSTRLSRKRRMEASPLPPTLDEPDAPN